MKYLSFDLEATGLAENDAIIEFAMIPFDTQSGQLEESLAKHLTIKCDSFENLKPHLDPWVIENNRDLIEKAHREGIEIAEFRREMQTYLTDPKVQNYFKDTPKEKVVLFGKSVNAIDLPFLNRDLGWNFMREYFHHQALDLSSVVMNKVDEGVLPPECLSGSGLMNHLGMGEVSHTALEDAINTAKMYLKILRLPAS